MTPLTESQKKEILDLYFNSSDNTITTICNVVGCDYQQAAYFVDCFLFHSKDQIAKVKSNIRIFHSKINK